MLHADPSRSYSWLWDSHINTKNSKWLQENLTDMDGKVKSMIKIIEEDADSFARRAEMYYKRRPELMKLVEEFYRAYRALAARYDHATGELRQAHRAMAEAFPDQIPFNLPEDSPRASSVSDSESNTSEVTNVVRSLFDLDDLQKDSSGASSFLPVVKKNIFSEENDASTSKKGLKQLNEMFLATSDKKTPESGGGIGMGKYADGKSRRHLTFQEGEEKSSGLELHARQGNAVEVRDMGTQYEAPHPETEKVESEDGMQLDGTSVTQSCKIPSESETERLSRAEAEVHDLKMVLSKLRQEQEAATIRSQQSLEEYKKSLQRISELETEVSHAGEEVRRLNEDILNGTVRFKSTEEKVSLLERSNQSLQLEVDNLEKKFILQDEKLKKKHCELEQLRIQIQEERLQSTSHERDLQSMRQLYSQLEEQHTVLVLELQKGTNLLKDMEHGNKVLEEKIVRLKEDNNSLNTENMSCTMSIKNLQDVLCSLNETKGKLEEEVGLHINQRNALQKELFSLKEERGDLDKRYKALIGQIKSVGLDSECLQSSVKNLQDEIILLKESCNKKDEEKAALCESLHNMEKLVEEYSLLERSLSDKNNDLEILRGKLKILEESLNSLKEEKSILVNENDNLSRQVDNIVQTLQIKEALNAEAEEKCLDLEKENKSVFNQLKELQACLNLEREERASIVRSSKTQLNNLEIKINFLLEEIEQKTTKLEENDACVLRAQIETTVVQCVILDMCKKNQNLSLECQKYLEILSNANKLISELKQKSLEQHMQLESILRKHSLTVEQNLKLRSGIEQLLELLLANDLDHDYLDKTGFEVNFQKLRSRVEAMSALLVTMQNENACMFFEGIIIATLLEQLGLEMSDLYVKKKALEMEAAAQAKELMILQSGKHELEKINDLLRQKVLSMERRENVLEAEIALACKQLSDSQELNRLVENQNQKLYEENRSLTKDILDLSRQKHSLEEETSAILYEAFSLGNLASIFECFNSEKEMEIQRLNEALDCIRGTNYKLKEEARALVERLKVLENENLHFRELAEKLEEYKICSVSLENEVDKFRNACGELKQQIELGQKLLNEKEFKLYDAEQKLETMQIEQAGIKRELERVKKEHSKAMTMKEVLEKEMMEITIDSANKSRTIDRMHEEEEMLKSELNRLHRRSDDLKLQEEHLKTLLKENMDELELLNTCCATLYYDLQVSVIHAAVLEQKVHELIDACKTLEEQSQAQAKKFLHENASKNAEIHELESMNAFLGEENEKMNLESIGYLSLISSLKESIVSVEDRCFALMGIQERISEDETSNHFNCKSEAHEWSEDKGEEKQDGLQELHKLKAKIQSIDMTVGDFENIKKEYHEVKLIKEALETELNILAEEIIMKSKEIKCVHEDKTKLEVESYELLEELDQCQFREVYFKCELKAKAGEIELCQTNSETLYQDLQSCSIHEALIEQKWFELIGAYEGLEIRSQHRAEKLLDDIACCNVEVDELKKKIMKLEQLNEEMSERSNKNLSFLSSVKESLCSLEDRCLAALGSQVSGTRKASDAGSHDQQNITDMVPESTLECAGTEKVVLELQELLLKLKTVERLVIELSQLGHFLKDKNERTHVAGPFGKDRIKGIDADEQMLELWETAERQSSHETGILASVKSASPDADAGGKFATQKTQRKHNDHEFSELQLEREVAVDKIEVSCETEKNKKRVRELLTSESRRLMDLQNIVQELNKRFDKLRNSSHPDGFEIDNAKEQLGRTELVILQLVEVNHKLLKNSQSSYTVSSERETGKLKTSTGSAEDLPFVDRPHLQEANKRLEKIEQLELELQRIELILKKLEDGHIKRIHAAVEKRAKVLLRDYLYGRGNRKQKKTPFCGCMRPLTKGD